MVLIEFVECKHDSESIKFPSPCGDYGSYHEIEMIVNYMRDLFPSPCGDYGSYQLIMRQRSSAHPMKFPSPCGDYGSYPVV